MKQAIVFSLLLSASPTFAGQMGEPNKDTSYPSYAFIGGGYYNGLYQKIDTDFENGALDTMSAYDLRTSNGYTQIGLGTRSHINTFRFDHQVSVIKLWGDNFFYSPHSTNRLRQNIDFGYDFMPLMNIIQPLYAYGLLGVHYAQFKYQKNPLVTPGITFNHAKDQIGFNLGAGLNYALTPNVVIGVKYQHLQYNSTKVQASSNAEHAIDAETFTPAFNLVGADLRFYWDQ